MSHRQPVRVGDISRFAEIIDARSPAEFALDHIPGAINCPVLSNEERATIGTLFVQVSPFEAKRLGAAMVSANLARHLRETFHDKPAHWKPLVYCWRGGLRSGSMVTWLRLVGWDAQQLAGGYKSFRRHVVEQLPACVERLDWRVLCGATGSGKTRILHAMRDAGAQVVDLEGLACHKGSLLGDVPGQAQPSQKFFETQLLTALQGLDAGRPVFVEGESAKIGRLMLPECLVRVMRDAPVLEVQARLAARLDFLLQDYAYLGDDPLGLCDKLARLKESCGRASIERWQMWVQQRRLPELFMELISLHYDPHYERSQSRHFRRWAARQPLVVDTLDAVGMSDAAQRLLSAAMSA